MDSEVMDVSSSSVMVDSVVSVVEYPEDSEYIDDATSDSEIERRNEMKIRLKSLYNRDSSVESAVDVSPPTDWTKFKQCVVCEEPITELVVWGLNRTYHCSCFVCFVCKESVAFRKFKVLEGKLLMCYKHYFETYQKCRVCQKPINNGAELKLKYEQLYHDSCFKCINCYKLMSPDDTMDLFDETYCRECADSVAAKKRILRSHYEALDRELR